MEKTLADRIILVTGASRGLGYAAARGLAKAGAHVVAVARTQGGLEELDDEIRNDGGSATLVPLDLRDGPGIDRLGGALFERFARLDGFLSNAGVLGALTPLSHLPPKTFEELVAVNLTANARLIRSLDPLLRASDGARVLFISSGAAQKHTPFWGAYAATKAALESLALTYAAECEGTKIAINIFNPGPTRTAMRAKAFPGEDPNSLTAPEDHVARIVEMLSPSYAQTGQVVRAG